MTIIEAVMGAIYASRNTPKENQAQYVALELLKAIEEPSDAMRAAYEKEWYAGRVKPDNYWKAMLSALSKQLEEQSK